MDTEIKEIPLKAQLAALANLSSEGHLNIKENVKLDYGIVYSEDQYKGSGPAYAEKFKKAGHSHRTRYSVSEYNEKFGSQSQMTHRRTHMLQSRAMQKDKETQPSDAL